MTYIAGKDKLSFGLTPTDIDVIDALAKKNFKKEAEAILGVSDFDQESPAERTSLLEAIDRILEAITNNPKLLPYTYSFKIETPPGSGMYSTGSGLASGIRINGELYSIQGGLDRCELIRDWWDESGNYHGDEPKDIRDLKSIKTDSDGEIIIRKRRKPTCLIRNLEQLRSFLLKSDVETIQKILG